MNGTITWCYRVTIRGVSSQSALWHRKAQEKRLNRAGEANQLEAQLRTVVSLEWC